MSSRRRPYLNLKQSIIKLFKTQAHWLKEFTSKWSIFEKPYLDDDYRAMHLRWSAPRWPSIPDWDGHWPESGGRRHTVIFDEGYCNVFAFSAGCGELVIVSGRLGLVPPGTLDLAHSWVATSSEPENARITEIETGILGGISADISVQLADDFTGTATICVQASIRKGSFLKEFAVLVPTHLGGVRIVEGWHPPWGDPIESLPLIYKIDVSSYVWDCGCVDITVQCDPCDDSSIAWDTEVSAEVIARENSVTVGIVDPLSSGGPYTWGVSGTGFTLEHLQTDGLTNTLHADASACGSAEIIVGGCGSNTTTGEVRCTDASEWVIVEECGVFVDESEFHCLYLWTDGKYEYLTQGCYVYFGGQTCTEYDCPNYGHLNCEQSDRLRDINYSNIKEWQCS